MAYYFPNQTNPELLKGLEIAESAGQNIPVQPAPAPPNGYVVDKSLVPQEKLPTMNDIYTARYADERQRDFKNNFPYPSLSPGEFAARNQVHTLKTAWQQAQEGINALDPNTDADTISKLRQVQKDSSDAANIIRNTAQTMGWNMTGIGADDSLALSTQLINMDRQRGMNELYNMPTAAAQKRNAYYEMINMGIAPHKARAVAERMGDEFREQNISRLIEGIGAYGSNGDGSLNEFGQMLAGKLYTEAPYQYGNIVNSFATPKELFNVNANMAQAAMQNANAFKNLITQITHQDQNLDKTLAHQSQEKALDRDHQIKMALINNAIRNSGTGTEQNKMEAEIADLTRLFGDEQRAKEFYLYRYYGNAIKAMNGDDSFVKDDAKLAKFADGQFGTIEYFLRNGDMQTAKNMIDEFKNEFTKIDFKYAEQNNRERANEILQTLDDYNKVADGEMTFDEYLEKSQGAWGDSWLSLKRRERSNEYQKTIEQAKAIGEDAARRNRVYQPQESTTPSYYGYSNPNFNALPYYYGHGYGNPQIGTQFANPYAVK